MAKRLATLKDYSLFLLKQDDDRFKLKAGDVLVGYPYTYDSGKTSIAFRLTDGFRPECNKYNSSIRPLTEDEMFRAMNGEMPSLKDDAH